MKISKYSFLKFVISIFLFFSCKQSNQTTDCNKYHTGTFYNHLIPKEPDLRFLIYRNDSTQIEINLKTGDTSKYRIKWHDKCNYDLHFIEGSGNLPDSMLKRRKERIYRTTILGGTDSFYLFETKVDKIDYTLSDTLWIKQ